MNRKELIIIVASILLIVGVIFFYSTNKTTVENTISNVNRNASQGNENINTPNSVEVPLVRDEVKSEQVIMNGKRIAYSNIEYGISFKYNQEVYQAPIIETAHEDLDDYYGKSFLRLLDNLMPNAETATGSVAIFKLVGMTQSFIDQETNLALKNECKIVSRDNIDGHKASWYYCPGLGDPYTVFIWHPKGYVLQIQVNFPGEYSDELIKSVNIL